MQENMCMAMKNINKRIADNMTIYMHMYLCVVNMAKHLFMWIYVCMCVYTSKSIKYISILCKNHLISAYVSIDLHICMYIRTYLCLYARKCVRAWVCTIMYICMCLSMQTKCMLVHTYISACLLFISSIDMHSLLPLRAFMQKVNNK